MKIFLEVREDKTVYIKKSQDGIPGRSERETEQPCELGNRESSRVWIEEFGWKYRKESLPGAAAISVKDDNNSNDVERGIIVKCPLQ